MSNIASKIYTSREGAQRLGISYRQTLRIKRRYETLGDEGLTHRSRGKASNRGFPKAFKDKVIDEYKKLYEGFGPTLAQEKLAEQGYEVNRETLRQWLIAEGLWERKKKKSKHRTRRIRKERFGDLLQIDGSIHPWFSDGRYTCLMNAVDDATSTSYAIMREGETTEAALSLLKGWIERYGIPKAVYVDLKNVYIAPKELSVFEEICQTLGIEIIKAYSPQAKGRVERNHGIYQDRLVKEIKLQGLTSIEEVNDLLENGFVAGLNERFAKTPAKPETGHAPLMEGVDLDDVICWQETRIVRNDWTIQYKGEHYQLKREASHMRPKMQVIVKQHLNGEISIHHGQERLPYTLLEQAPQPKKTYKPVKAKRIRKVPCDHPLKDRRKAYQKLARQVKAFAQRC